MSATIIDGKQISAQVREEVAEQVRAFVASGKPAPRLMVVLVGDHPASASYVRSKARAAGEAGIRGETLYLKEQTTEQELLDTIRSLNEDADVDGILVQLPLPGHIDENKVLLAIDPDKDVDGFHPLNAGRLATGTPVFVPATPAGVLEMLKRTGIETAGRHAVIVGRSNIVGKPMAALLMQKGIDATVTVCHSRTRNLPELTRSADILIAAIGQAHFVEAGMIKPGAAVIDVGINRVEDAADPRGYHITGDVDFEAAKEIAGAITPVPGGVGLMTVAMLLAGTLHAARLRR